MGSSPPVCSFTASLIQVAHVESRCATIIYMNGIENFLLRGGEKDTKEREPTPTDRQREGGREKERKEGGRRSEKTDIQREREREVETHREERTTGAERNSEGAGEREDDRESAGLRRGRKGKEGRKERRAKIFWHFMSVITRKMVRPIRPADRPIPPPPPRPVRSQPTSQHATSSFSNPPRLLNPLQLPPSGLRSSFQLCPL